MDELDKAPVERRLGVRLTQGGPVEELPAFARWLIRLGRRTYDSHRAGEPRFVTLVVPARPYAAGFLALGVLDAAITATERAQPHLVPGTTVRIWNGDNTVQVGTFLRYETKTVLGVTRDYVIIGLKDKRVEGIPVEQARVERIDVEGIPLSKFQGKKAPAWFTTVQQAFPYPDLTSRLSAVSDVATLIGARSRLERELSELEVHVHGAEQPIDLLSLLFARKQPPFEREVHLMSAKDDAISAQVVILDGEQAVFHHGTTGQEGSVIALLEPTSAAFHTAVDTLHGSLQFAQPDHDWVTGGCAAPALEWTCHLR